MVGWAQRPSVGGGRRGRAARPNGDRRRRTARARHDRWVRWIGHAGLAAGRPAGAPDAACLERAARLGLDRLEVDVAATADGAVVLLHDRILPSGYPVEALTLARARAEVPGLLRLEEAREIVGRSLPLLVDLKGASVLTALVAHLAASPPAVDDLAVCTDDPVALAVLRERVPWVPRWRTLPRVGSGAGARRRRIVADLRRRRLVAALPRLVAEVGAVGLSVDHWAVTAGLCREAHRLGVTVAAWTVNETPRARALAARGVDYLTSDAVETLRPLLDGPVSG